MTFPLEELGYLESLDRLGSASAAARELDVAPSTVYRKIDALEKEIGVVCLSRGGGVTEAGRELAESARRARASLGEVVRRLRGETATIEGSVSVTTVAGFVPLLTTAFASVTRAHPGLRIELHVADDGPSVRDREVDVALSVLPEPPPQLVGRRVLTIRYAAFAIEPLATQTDPRWVVLAPPMHTTPQARWEAAHVPKARVAAATGSRLAFLDLVRAGVGAGVLPRLLAHRCGDLREIAAGRDSLGQLDRPAWLLTHPDLKGSAKVSAVIDAIGAALDAENERIERR